MRRIALIKMFGVLLGLLLVAGACGDSDVSTAGEASGDSEVPTAGETSDDNEVPTVSETSDDNEVPTAGEVGGGGRFCDLAREFDDEDFNPGDFSEEYFDRMDDLMGRAISLAPGEIRGDMETSREGFRALAKILAEYNYNILDPDLATAMDNLDNDEMDAAGNRIDEFLERECGITDEPSASGLAPAGSLPGNIEDLDDAAGFVQAMVLLFGIDAELAECLRDELGEFDTGNPDPELLTKEVCGTSLLEILTNPSR